MTTDSTTSAATSGASDEEWERSHAAWEQAVAGVLAKSRKVDVSELPSPPQSLLDTTTYDGVRITPLYTPADERDQAPLPGRWPFVRGRDRHRDVTVGWLVTQQVGARGDARAVNEEILAGLENGTSALWLKLGGDGLAPTELLAALAGVYLDLAPVTLDAGADTAGAADAFFALLDGAEIADRSAVRAGLGAAPLTDDFRDAAGIDLGGAVALAVAASGRAESIRAITVDGTAFHNAGAADAEELGAAVAAGLEYLRALVDAGLSAADALGQIEFRLAATDDQFQTIAKFRAGRQLWARVAQVCGAPDAGAAPQHAVTSAAMMAQRDPWVNMLRTTLAAFGAGVGGADSVTVLPFDAALPAGSAATSKAFATRIARNTQLLLLEESHLGQVVDPGAGSWYVEDLTAQIAAKAWEFVQQIESAGGYSQAHGAGVVSERIDATRARRESDIAHRRTAVTGVNEFPNLDEPSPAHGDAPLVGVARYAAAFEALRDRSDVFVAEHGHRPKVLLAALGPVAEHNGRTTFAANLLASGGIEAVNAGPLDLATVADVVRESQTDVAVLCGTDKRYGSDGVPAVQALRAAGIATVLLAGPEKTFESATGADRPDGFLTARIDAVSALTGLLDTLGAK